MINLNLRKWIMTASDMFRTKNRIQFYGKDLNSNNLTLNFEARWRAMNDSERKQIARDYEPLQKMDWKSLNLDQKKIRNNKMRDFVLFLIQICTSLHDSLWTGRYSRPERRN